MESLHAKWGRAALMRRIAFQSRRGVGGASGQQVYKCRTGEREWQQEDQESEPEHTHTAGNLRTGEEPSLKGTMCLYISQKALLKIVLTGGTDVKIMPCHFLTAIY